MEKKTINIHAYTIHIYSIAILAFIALSLILGLKYAHLKLAMNRYTQGTLMMNAQNVSKAQISDYGTIIALSAQTVPAADLEGYISSLSKTLNRDIVVLDKNKKVLADTVSSNKGAVYSFDLNSEIEKTMEDGQARGFEERSVDYPAGLAQVVVAMKDANGQTVGAVIISNAPLPQQ